MNDVDRAAWRDFVQVVQNFLGNTKAPNYIELVESMFTSYKNLGANMSIKVHFLDNHLERFPENLGDFSEEQGERFHQDIKVMEERYQGKWDVHMLGDYCWSLMRDCDADHSRNSRKRIFKPSDK